MRPILNVICLVFGGLWLAVGYLVAALVCFLLISSPTRYERVPV